MGFTITYRDPQQPDFAGATYIGEKSRALEAIVRLQREGYEVTRISPPLDKHDLFRRPKIRPDLRLAAQREDGEPPKDKEHRISD